MDITKCVNNDAISVTDGSKSLAGVRRCRDTEATSSAASGKRRKFNLRDQEDAVPSENPCRSEFDVNSPEDAVSSAESGNYDHVPSSPCLKHCLSLDLEAELRFETETFMSGNGGVSGETSQSSEICLDLDKIESNSTTKQNPAPPPVVTSRRTPPATAEIFPTAAEIDEFFSVAEKKEHKRFSDKYNFDIVNDVPMDGRYQWVRCNP